MPLLAPIEGTPYVGGNAPGFMSVDGSGLQVLVKNNLTATTNPGVNNDSSSGQDYAVGSRWTNTASGQVWECVDATVSAAVWKDLSLDPVGTSSTTEILYNNAGTVDGIAGSAWDGTTATLPNAKVTTSLGIGATPTGTAGDLTVAGELFMEDLTLNALTYINSSGALAALSGASVGSNSALTLTAQATTAIPLSIVRGVAQTADLLNITSTSAGDLVTVDKDGNVGIGTTAPDVRLNVQTDTNAFDGIHVENLNSGTKGQVNIFFDNDTGATERFQITMGSSGNTQASIIGLSRVNTAFFLKDGTGDLAFANRGTGDVVFGQNNAEAMRITDGNVGIGETSPSAMLDIVPAAATDIGLEINSAASQSADLLNITSNGGSAGDLVTVDKDGNVGIGATDPSNFLLQTAGNIGPNADSTYDLGSSSLRWANVYADGVDITGAGNINQSNASAATPVLTLQQQDVSEEFLKLIGTSAADASQSLVDAADMTTPGSIVGWAKVFVQDDQGTGPIADGEYFLPFYSAPTA